MAGASPWGSSRHHIASARRGSSTRCVTAQGFQELATGRVPDHPVTAHRFAICRKRRVHREAGGPRMVVGEPSPWSGLDDELCTWSDTPLVLTRANVGDQWPQPITPLTQDLVWE